jgi:hypothetical protein
MSIAVFGWVALGVRTRCESAPAESSASRPTRTGLAVITPGAGQKHQAELADLHLITIGQHGRIHRLAIDVGAVEAADVTDLEFAVLQPELGIILLDPWPTRCDGGSLVGDAKNLSTDVIDQLVDEQLARGQRANNVGQDFCPLCRGDWHERLVELAGIHESALLGPFCPAGLCGPLRVFTLIGCCQRWRHL